MKTIVGKDGYLFLNHDRELNIHTDVCKIEIDMSKYNDYKHKMIFVVFPDKSVLCKAFVPDVYTIKYRPTFDVYKDYFKEQLIDGYDFLTHDDFYKTDTHINLKGSYTLFCHFIKKLNELFKLNHVYETASIEKKSVPSLNDLNLGIGDLTWPMNLGGQTLKSTDDTYYYSNTITSIYLKHVIQQGDLMLIKNNVIESTDSFIGNPVGWDILSKHILYKKNKDKHGKCLICYDSFLLSTLDLYLHLFEEVYMSKSMFNASMIEIIQPDYIFEFRIERFLN